MDLEKELEKLEDYKMDYKLALLTRQDDKTIAYMQGRMVKQANIVNNISKMAYNKQKDKNNINTTEEKKPVRKRI